VLEAHDLSAIRGHTRLFSGVTARVAPGNVLLVGGPNGSGKTTLLRMLAGLSTPASGTIRWQGDDVAPFDARLREASVFAGHLPALKDDLTVRENLASLVALGGDRATPQALDAALDEVALARQGALPVRVLSQGQRRRIALARVKLVRKPLWILDEPATALDADGIALLASLLLQHLDAHGMAVVATHQPLALPGARAQALTLEAPA